MTEFSKTISLSQVALTSVQEVENLAPLGVFLHSHL